MILPHMDVAMATDNSNKSNEAFIEDISQKKSTVENEQPFVVEAKLQRCLRRKQDLCITTMLSGCYFFAYLVVMLRQF